MRDITKVTIKTAFKHMFLGRPRKTWTFPTHVAVNMIRRGFRSTFGTIRTKAELDNLRDALDREGLLKSPEDYVPEPDMLILPAHRAKSSDIMHGLLKDTGVYDRVEEKRSSVDSGWEHELSGMWVDYREGCNGVPRTTATPTILYIHGGFHVACTTLTYRGLLCKLSRQSDCPIFAPRYRKAPENPFPLALEDILAAFMQLLEDPQVDPNNIIIAGDSSGAGMAVALRMILKDAGLPGPAGMLLWYPYLDMTLSLPSVKGNGRWDSNIDYADFLPNDSTRDLALYTGDHYYVRDKALLSHPYVSPLMADSFGDMGPTLVQIGEVDRNFDESAQFAQRAAQEDLASKGRSQMRLEIYRDMPHLLHFLFTVSLSDVAIKRSGSFVRELVQRETQMDGGKWMVMRKADMKSKRRFPFKLKG